MSVGGSGTGGEGSGGGGGTGGEGTGGGGGTRGGVGGTGGGGGTGGCRLGHEHAKERPKGRSESSAGRSPKKAEIWLKDVAVIVGGPDTPAKKELEQKIEKLGGTLLSPTRCLNCSHLALDHYVEKHKLLLQTTETCSHCAESRVKIQKAQRSLSFGDNFDLSWEDEMRKMNHQLFVCDEDTSPFTTLQAYVESRRHGLVSEIVTPGAQGIDHISHCTNPEIKAVSREAFVLLHCLHKAGLSLGGEIKMTNFILDEAKGRMNARLSIKRGHLKRLDPDNKRLDLDSFIFMIRRELFVEPPLPHDVNFWLSLIGESGLEELVSDSISIMDDQTAMSNFMSLYDRFKHLEKSDPESFNQIVKALNRYNRWKDAFKGRSANLYLKDTIDFINTHTKKTTIYREDASGLLQLLRNCKNHAAVVLLHDFLLVVGHEFPNIIYHFQIEMFRAGFKA